MQDQERLAVAALLLIGRPASAGEIGEVCSKLGARVEELGTMCASGKSPVCFGLGKYITFSAKADSFFQNALLTFRRLDLALAATPSVPESCIDSVPSVELGGCRMAAVSSSTERTISDPPRFPSESFKSMRQSNVGVSSSSSTGKRGPEETVGVGKARRCSLSDSPNVFRSSIFEDERRKSAGSQEAESTVPVVMQPMDEVMTAIVAHTMEEARTSQVVNVLPVDEHYKWTTEGGEALPGNEHQETLQGGGTDDKRTAAADEKTREECIDVFPRQDVGLPEPVHEAVVSQRDRTGDPEVFTMCGNRETEYVHCPIPPAGTSSAPGAGNSLDAVPLQYVLPTGEVCTVGNLSRKENIMLHKKKNKEVVAIPAFQNYRLESEEGSGGYGVVYKARRLEDGRSFAIKFPFEEVSKEQINKEIRMLKTLGGKHCIVRLEEVIKEGDNQFIVMDYMEHDKPHDLKKNISLRQLRWYGFFLFKALNYVHQKGIAHRDVKPGNFLFSRKNNTGCLVDFNLAMEFPNAPKSLPNRESPLCLPPIEKTFVEERKALFVKPNRHQPVEPVSPVKPQQATMEPIPTVGRKRILDYVTQSMAQNTTALVKRKRVTAVKSSKILTGCAKRVPVLSPDNNPPQPQKRPKQPQGWVGTKGYCAPEVLLRSKQTIKVDMWSAGVTLLQLATSKLPFSGGTHQTIKEIAKLRGTADLKKLAATNTRSQALFEEFLKLETGNSAGPSSLSEWAEASNVALPSSFIDLVDRCLRVDPSERISAREAMQHEFFSPCLSLRERNR